jgi:hypothetical protein
MTAPRSGRFLQQLMILFLGSMLVMVTGGCRLPLLAKSAPLSDVPLSELISYKDAVDIYEAGEYGKSALQFESIRKTTSSAVLSRMALFGLACSRMMSAETPETFQEALSLWEGWVQSAPPHRQDVENPALLTPLIRKKTIFSYGITQDRKLPTWLLEMADQEMQNLRRQLEEAGRGIDARDKKIKTLEKEILRLNEQISAFETIDQKVQKRKHAIPSAE